MCVKLTYNLEIKTPPAEAINLLAGRHSVFSLILVMYSLSLAKRNILLAALADIFRLLSHLKGPRRSWTVFTELRPVTEYG
jgi:hypothetical protein